MTFSWLIVFVLILGYYVNEIVFAAVACSGPQCVSDRTCEPLVSSSLSINCMASRGRGVPCNRRVAPGTRANLFCKEGFEQREEPGYTSISCGDDGIWDKCPFDCQPICGVSNPASQDGDLGRFPWYATVFRITRVGREPKIVCGGSIISDRIILTAAHCVYDGNLQSKVDTAKVKIGLGTGIVKWSEISAPNTQFYNVEQIVTHPKFQGIALYLRDDIAAVVLDRKINFTEYIAPACIDFQFKGPITEPPKGTTYSVAGYRTAISGVIENIKLPAIPSRECTEKSAEDFVSFLSAGKLCAGDFNGSEFLGLEGFGGSGTMLPQNTRDGDINFLRGILSVGSNFQGILAITDVLVYLDWIKEVLNSVVDPEKPQFCGKVTDSVTSNEINECAVPPLIENGDYVVGGLATLPPPGTLVPEWSVIKYTCNPTYGLIGEETAICTSGRWPPRPSCFKKCKALKSTSVQLDCKFNGKKVPCDEPVKAGTIAYLQCKRGYKLPYTPDFNSVTCGEDGTWDFSLYRCIADCGIARPNGISLVIDGQNALYQDFPWHVGIYRRKGVDKHDLICGGTIVTARMVISAAHCFFPPGAHTPTHKSQFSVAAGKVYIEYNDAKDTDAQYSDIQNLIIPEAYDDIHGNYAQDIALLELTVTLDFSPLVRPVCVDWNFQGAEEEFVAGTKGLVSGWGLTTEGGEPSPYLRYAILPTVTRQTCLENSPNDFRPFITPDKFCAGYLNGTSLCKGDSGGGLSIPYSDNKTPVYYLRGIVSVGPTQNGTCDSHRYTAFTRVLSHINWIRKHRV